MCLNFTNIRDCLLCEDVSHEHRIQAPVKKQQRINRMTTLNWNLSVDQTKLKLYVNMKYQVTLTECCF